MQQFSQPLLECFFQPLLQALPKALAGALLLLQLDEFGIIGGRECVDAINLEVGVGLSAVSKPVSTGCEQLVVAAVGESGREG